MIVLLEAQKGVSTQDILVSEVYIIDSWVAVEKSIFNPTGK